MNVLTYDETDTGESSVFARVVLRALGAKRGIDTSPKIDSLVS